MRISANTKTEIGECDSHNCTQCGKNEEFKAIWRKYSKRLEFFGTPIKTYSEGINVYCNSCYNKSDHTDEEKSDEETLDRSLDDANKSLN